MTTNTIDAPIVSFYVHNNSYRTTSMMKFGGWDWMGFRSDQDNNVFRTSNSSSWAIPNIKYTASFQGISTGSNTSLLNIDGTPSTNQRDFLIVPEWPYIYIPTEDFDAMVAAWPSGAPNNGGAIIDPSKRFIKWNQKCSTIKTSWANGANMSFVINFQLSTNQQL